jgi:hypothetical protein
LYSLDEFSGFFNACEVGCEDGVVDIIETDFAECRNEFTDVILSDWKSEFFSDGDAYRGCNLCNDDFLWIVNSLPDFFVVAMRVDGSDWAYGCALSAVDAIDVGKWQAEGWCDDDGMTSSSEIKDAVVLNFGASSDAITTEDAFSLVSDDGW